MSPATKYLVAASLAAASALAQGAERGVYAGAGIGSATASRDDYDNSTDTYLLFAGLQSEGFGLEIAYVDLGEFEHKSLSQNRYGVDGVRLDARGELFLSKGVYGYGNFGFYNWNLDDKSGGGSDDSGTSVVFGLGLRVMAGEHLFGRGGWERYNDISGDNSDLLSLNLGYLF